MGVGQAALLALLLSRCDEGVDASSLVSSSGCTSNDSLQGSCDAVSTGGTAWRREFWKEMRRQGLQLKLKRRTVKEKAGSGLLARNRTAMVLSDDVFYGRAIMKIPRPALLSIETAPNVQLRRELTSFLFDDRTLERIHNITSEESSHLFSLAYPLIAEHRDPESVFRKWLDAVQGERLTVLQLSERQRLVLNGTTVEGAYDEMVRNRDMIMHTATNLSFFRHMPVTLDEAAWALAVIMRHARIVHPHQDVRDTREARMYLFPITDLLGVHLHPDPDIAISFQEEITLEEHKEVEMVLQIARRDMRKDEEVFLSPGRLSNSEMVMRHGFSFPSNPVGIGRNATEPPNWSANQKSQIRKEYAKYNCSSLESFEIRISSRGYPMRNFVRCYRVSWFLTNGWYSPALAGRIHDLNTWPPPKKYTKEDWLSWTQADAELNRAVLEYCTMMRQQLKETMDGLTAADFRTSRDPMDRLLWHLRGEESKTFKDCVTLAKKAIT